LEVQLEAQYGAFNQIKVFSVFGWFGNWNMCFELYRCNLQLVLLRRNRLPYIYSEDVSHKIAAAAFAARCASA
jgi:hypothetical protein